MRNPPPWRRVVTAVPIFSCSRLVRNALSDSMPTARYFGAKIADATPLRPALRPALRHSTFLFCQMLVMDCKARSLALPSTT